MGERRGGVWRLLFVADGRRRRHLVVVAVVVKTQFIAVKYACNNRGRSMT